MENLHQPFREEITTAQLRQKENYDKERNADPNRKSGDMVWFLPHNVKTTRPSKKLDYKKMGPFKIIRKDQVFFVIGRITGPHGMVL